MEGIEMDEFGGLYPRQESQSTPVPAAMILSVTYFSDPFALPSNSSRVALFGTTITIPTLRTPSFRVIFWKLLS